MLQLFPEVNNILSGYLDGQVRLSMKVIFIWNELGKIEFPYFESVLVDAVVNSELLKIPLQVINLRNHLLFLVEHQCWMGKSLLKPIQSLLVIKLGFFETINLILNVNIELFPSLFIPSEHNTLVVLLNSLLEEP